MERKNKCSGDGKCFSLENKHDVIFPFDSTRCEFKCKPKPCEICGILLPEYIYNCKNRKGVNCDINPDLFNNNNLSTTKLSLNDFTIRMNKLSIKERIERYNSLCSESTHSYYDKLYMLNFMEDSEEYKWLEAEGYIDHTVSTKEKFYEYLPKKLHSYYKWININGNPYYEDNVKYFKMIFHKFFEKWIHIILGDKDGEYIRRL